jgi:hypothetical protein
MPGFEQTVACTDTPDRPKQLPVAQSVLARLQNLEQQTTQISQPRQLRISSFHHLTANASPYRNGLERSALQAYDSLNIESRNPKKRPKETLQSLCWLVSTTPPSPQPETRILEFVELYRLE